MNPRGELCSRKNVIWLALRETVFLNPPFWQHCIYRRWDIDCLAFRRFLQFCPHIFRRRRQWVLPSFDLCDRVNVIRLVVSLALFFDPISWKHFQNNTAFIFPQHFIDGIILFWSLIIIHVLHIFPNQYCPIMLFFFDYTKNLS